MLAVMRECEIFSPPIFLASLQNAIMRNTPRLASMAVLLVLIVALGITFFKVVAPFLLPLFLAGMTAVVSQPLFRYFLARVRGRVHLAAAATTAAIVAAILIPLITATLMASLQMYAFAADSDLLHEKSKAVFQQSAEIANRFLPQDQHLTSEQLSHDVAVWIKSSLTEIGNKSLGRAAGTTFGILAGTAGFVVSFVIGILMFAISLYYFLADGTTLLESAESLIPVNVEYQRQLLLEFSKVVRAVVVATFLAALAQGLATTLAIWFFGFHHLFALFLLATLAALIPLAGTWLVWLPCAIALFTSGHALQAVLLMLYGAVFVGFLDNIVRTYVLNSDAKLHPLLAFISVLGGIQAMGLWGVFIGPIVASCLYALVKIFNHELTQLSREKVNQGMGSVVPLPAAEVPVASISSESPSVSGTGNQAAG